MSDNKEDRAPVLKPKDKVYNPFSIARSSGDEPVLKPGKGYYEKSSPPYVLIVITLIGISLVCWKMIMRDNSDVVKSDPNHIQELEGRTKSIR
ncbi:MAG: hypothetical protein ACRBB3_04825 [Alphaproteobacteria bacterium]